MERSTKFLKSNMSAHSESCNRASENARAERDAYAEKWPKFCRRCDAYGGRATGGTRLVPPDFDDCRACLCAGKCPRCGAEALDDADLDVSCSACRWQLSQGEGAPSAWECYGDCVDHDDGKRD